MNYIQLMPITSTCYYAYLWVDNHLKSRMCTVYKNVFPSYLILNPLKKTSRHFKPPFGV